MSTVLASEIRLPGVDLPAPTPARIEMVQFASESRDEGGAQCGTFRDMETGQQFKTLNMRMLAIACSRVLWPEKIGLPQSKQFACRSFDGIVPDPIVVKPFSADCDTCPHAQWVNGKRPACNEKAQLLFINEKTGKLHVITLSGSSLGRKTPRPTGLLAVKMSIANDALARAAKGTAVKMHDYIVTVKSVKGDGNFKYYVMEPVKLKFQPVKPETASLFTNALLGNRKLLYGA